MFYPHQKFCGKNNFIIIINKINRTIVIINYLKQTVLNIIIIKKNISEIISTHNQYFQIHPYYIGTKNENLRNIYKVSIIVRCRIFI